MEIHELEARTGVTTKTIRFYEQIGVLPLPRRKSNGYREYDENDVERLKFVAGARQLDFSLDDIAEILALRDRREAPCRVVLELLEHKFREVARRIEELQKLEMDLRKLHELGATFPMDDVDGKNCVCHLVSSRAGQTGNISTAEQ
jgi:DNA-binding transcriptional MerR regulator